MSDTKLQFPSINLRGFNVRPGVAWLDDAGDRVWIATTKVTNDGTNELIHVVARSGVFPADYTGGPLPREYKPRSFTFDYCDEVKMIGVVHNPNDEDDNDFGADASADVYDLVEDLTMFADNLEDVYEVAIESAIALIHASGYDGNSMDIRGEEVAGLGQSLLMAAMCRMPALAETVHNIVTGRHSSFVCNDPDHADCEWVLEHKNRIA